MAALTAVNQANGVSDGGLGRDADEASVLAQRASDARVVVDLIATNGTGPRSYTGRTELKCVFCDKLDL